MAKNDNKEEQLIEISSEFDEFFVTLSHKYKQHPLNLASIGLARLIVMCKATNCVDEFFKVVDQIEDDIEGLDVASKPAEEVKIH